MEFEWDSAKSLVNREKHGVSFDEAVVIWDGVHVEVESIAYSEDGEKRNATLGWIDHQIYLAIWTKRRRKIRLISVRRARKNEEKIFSEKVQDK